MPIDNMPVEQLNYWLSKFVCEVRKQDGNEYPPSSLLSLVMGLQSYIKVTAKRNLEILKNPQFEEFRQVLDAEMKRLSGTGRGSASRKAEVISVENEDFCGVRSF